MLGTLIAPKVVLTAGHCTEGPTTNVLVSFDDKLIPDPLAAGPATPSGVIGCRTTSPARRIPTRRGTDG